MAVGVRHEFRALLDNGVGDDGGAKDAVLLGKKGTRKKIKMLSSKIPDRAHLPGFIMACDPTGFDLVARSVCGDGVDIGIGIARPGPSERLAEQVFAEITGWVVRAAGDPTRTQRFFDARMKRQQFDRPEVRNIHLLNGIMSSISIVQSPLCMNNIDVVHMLDGVPLKSWSSLERSLTSGQCSR